MSDEAQAENLVKIEGSRREVKGIVTLDDAAKAIEALFGSEGGVPVDAPFHCYLDGTSFAIWTEGEAVVGRTG